ncbi:MFS transporter [Deinococcus lacus]|uniref:MFS transporter n=1 Tax=Deinococcus lacus TaxID=392561 RepID=A0ABW1YAZ6_9DEIO
MLPRPDYARLLPLYLAQALATGAATVSTMLASLVMAQLGQEPLSGLPSTLQSVAGAVSAALFGALMLRRGRKLGLGGAFVLGAAGAFLGFAGAKTGLTPAFLAGALLLGAAQGGFQQARYAAAESVPARVRGLALGVLMLMSVFGSVLMHLFGPQLAQLGHSLQTSVEVTGWLAAAGLLLVSAALIGFWQPAGPQALEGPAPAAPAQPAGWRHTLRQPGVAGAVVAVAVSQTVMVALMSLTPLRAHHLGLGHGPVSELVTGHIAGMFAFGLLTGPLIDRLGLRFGFASGAALLVLAAATSWPATTLGCCSACSRLGWGGIWSR